MQRVLIPLNSGHQSGLGRVHGLLRSREVLIPLNSGHQSGRRGMKTLAVRQVLIPLNSGHQSGHERGASAQDQAQRLNPFEFRASVRTLRVRQSA